MDSGTCSDPGPAAAHGATLPGALSGAGVHALFERQAARTPDAVALISGDERITYGRLDEAANRMARYLIGHGAERGAIAAIILPRGMGLVAGLLGTLKAGAGYILIDPDLPAARRHAILADSGASLMVDHDVVDRALADPSPAQSPRVPVTADMVACIVFTSGSTGRPKGVAIPHRALIATYTGQTYARFDPDQVWLQCSPVFWDAFALELFGALLHGGVCVLYPGQCVDPQRLAEVVARHRVTQLQLTASLFNLLTDEFPHAFEGVRLAFTGGERASVQHVARLLARHPDLRVANGYGPVESLGFTTVHPVRPADLGRAALPIGTPIANKGIRVLDDGLRQVPAGQTGELWATGAGLAHGYARQPGLTASAFLSDPYGAPQDRMYRTGDLGYQDPDGTLHITGRADDQVKIRGFRIEPADIAHALQQLPGVRQAAVVAHHPAPDQPELAAYVTTTRTGPDAVRLREGLARLLPAYMIPASIAVLPDLPLTPNGKLDLDRLRGMAPANGCSEARCVA
jgi:amino acid adenylation domain-containing protein